MVPPIPHSLEHLAAVHGYAAPWISAHHRDGTPVLGAVDPDRVEHAFASRLCQTCGRPLARGVGAEIVCLARPSDIAERYLSEPGMHITCAAYSLAACPMLRGAMPRHRAAANVDRCSDPLCSCQLRAQTPAPSPRLGAPAEPWYVLELGDDHYLPARRDDAPGLTSSAPGGRRARLVLPLPGVEFRKVQPIHATGATDNYARFIMMTGALGALFHRPIA